MVLMKETAVAAETGHDDVKHSEEEQCPELVEVKKQKVDHSQDEYFTSYDSVEVHRLMIRDKPRTEAYRDAILNNSQYFKDKIVMDIGAGTGILSLFAKQAGAKKVFAVEASPLADVLKEIVEINDEEGVIEVIHGKAEEIELDTKVDIIIQLFSCLSSAKSLNLAVNHNCFASFCGSCRRLKMEFPDDSQRCPGRHGGLVCRWGTRDNPVLYCTLVFCNSCEHSLLAHMPQEVTCTSPGLPC